ARVARPRVAVVRTEPLVCLFSRPPAAEAMGDVTYAAHVAPLLERYCVACHRPGQGGPMSLQTYDDVAAWSKTIVEVLGQNRMPPWSSALPDPRYGDFVELPVPSEEEKALFAEWARSGMPRGNLADMPPA